MWQLCEGFSISCFWVWGNWEWYLDCSFVKLIIMQCFITDKSKAKSYKSLHFSGKTLEKSWGTQLYSITQETDDVEFWNCIWAQVDSMILFSIQILANLERNLFALQPVFRMTRIQSNKSIKTQLSAFVVTENCQANF